MTPWPANKQIIKWRGSSWTNDAVLTLRQVFCTQSPGPLLLCVQSNQCTRTLYPLLPTLPIQPSPMLFKTRWNPQCTQFSPENFMELIYSTWVIVKDGSTESAGGSHCRLNDATWHLFFSEGSLLSARTLGKDEMIAEYSVQNLVEGVYSQGVQCLVCRHPSPSRWCLQQSWPRKSCRRWWLRFLVIFLALSRWLQGQYPDTGKTHPSRVVTDNNLTKYRYITQATYTWQSAAKWRNEAKVTPLPPSLLAKGKVVTN